jgi:alkylhydroperoxidase family enzyme
MSPPPRIAPGTRAQVGRVNWAIARAIGLANGGAPPNIFLTLARHRRLFRPWLRFAGRLMPGGKLPRDESELLILRVAHNCGSEYEWTQHERIALTAGLSAEEVERVRSGPDAAGWSERRTLLLRAADELHSEARCVSDGTWAGLSAELSDTRMLEVCLLVGHYEMLAMTLNSAGVVPDPPTGKPPRAMRALQALQQRRG